MLSAFADAAKRTPSAGSQPQRSANIGPATDKDLTCWRRAAKNDRRGAEKITVIFSERYAIARLHVNAGNHACTWRCGSGRAVMLGSSSCGFSAPEVSFVVTLYNKRRFLPFLLASFAAQHPERFAEYIFVDDGSTDGTADELFRRTSGWPHVTLLRQSNLGPAVALNRGMALARGTFIKPMDGDDLLLPWATTRLIEAIARTGAMAALAAQADTGAYDPDCEGPSEALDRRAPAATAPELCNLLPKSLRVAQSNPSHWLFRRELLSKIGGCDEGVFVQDYSLELAIGWAGPVALVRGPLLCLPTTVAGRLGENVAQTLHDINAAVLRFLRQRPDVPLQLRRFAIRRATGRAAKWARRHGGAGAFGTTSLLRVPAMFGLLPPTERVEDMLCAPFRATAPIRLPRHPAEQAEGLCGRLAKVEQDSH